MCGHFGDSMKLHIGDEPFHPPRCTQSEVRGPMMLR